MALLHCQSYTHFFVDNANFVALFVNKSVVPVYDLYLFLQLNIL